MFFEVLVGLLKLAAFCGSFTIATLLLVVGWKLWKNRHEFDCHFEGDYENIPAVDRKGRLCIVRRMTDAKAQRFLR